MRAAAYLTNPQAASRLDASAAGHCELVFVDSWSDLDRVIRRQPIEIAVVDPVRESQVELGPLERLRTYYPSLSIVLYMSFAPNVADALLRLGSIGLQGAVFLDHGDTPAALAAALDEAIEDSVSESLLASIASGMRLESTEVVAIFRAALQQAENIRTARDWSRYHGMSYRSLYRLFQDRGLPTPKTCLLWLRLMYAARSLENPGYNLSDVVHRMGYSAPSNFWQHVQDVLGVQAADLRFAAGYDALLERFLTEHVRSQPEQRSL